LTNLASTCHLGDRHHGYMTRRQSILNGSLSTSLPLQHLDTWRQPANCFCT